jgi:uncharacterized membrane protein YraQ (UPF0718 family)
MIGLWVFAGAAALVSLAVDREKTRRAFRIGLRMFAGIAPFLLAVLAFVSLVMAALTAETLRAVLGGRGIGPFFAALGIGSVALIPGFVAFPLASVLRHYGAANATLAAFITSLLMVGVLTLPVEAKYFGWRVSLLRNALALGGAIVVAGVMALVLG